VIIHVDTHQNTVISTQYSQHAAEIFCVGCTLHN